MLPDVKQAIVQVVHYHSGVFSETQASHTVTVHRAWAAGARAARAIFMKGGYVTAAAAYQQAPRSDAGAAAAHDHH